MRKNQGKVQQKRGHKRRAKVVNRRKMRNASDVSRDPGVKYIEEYLNA